MQKNNELIEQHLYTAEVAAARALRKMSCSYEFDDLYQDACVGLVLAARDYRHDSQASFKAYAFKRVNGAVWRGIANWSPYSRHTYHSENIQHTEISINGRRSVNATGSPMDEQLNIAGDYNYPFDWYSRHDAKRLISRLSSQNSRSVMSMRYLKDMEFKDIAVKLGLCKARVSQIHSEALASIQEYVGGRRP